ncbi:MAG: recombinase family protein [Halobacteria archaeon]|nr:recombinase family protein [Halobacteria archaeon]
MTGLDQTLSQFSNDRISDEDEIVLAAIYARTSSTNQRFGYSLSEQVRICRERCEDLGWEVSHIFRDEAESGKDTDRPMFQKMMEKAEERLFDVVVFWKLDRFSRSLLHAVELEEKLSSLDIALHSVTEQIDTTTAAGRFNFRNIANAAEFEREMIKQRTQMGMQALAQDRKWPNDTPPLGYRLDEDRHLEIKEDEADLVREIFRMYINKRSMPQVAFELNKKGIRVHGSEEWTTKKVSDVLKNELYKGEYDVADVNEYVPEYQIVESDVFEEVTRIRHRFQSDEESSRETMSSDRKEKKVKDMVDTYLDSYLGH